MNIPSFLSGINEDKVNNYINQGTIKISSYGKNNIIHFEGDCCFSLEIVLEGKVTVDRIDESGDLLTVAEFYKGDIIGGNLIFSKNPYYPMTISTKVNSNIMEIPKEIIFEFCTENCDFLKRFLQSISDNALLLGDKIKHYVSRTIRESVISFLKYEYSIQGKEKITLNMTKKALSEKIGVQRTSLSRELQKMKNDGLINYDSSTITVLKKEILG